MTQLSAALPDASMLRILSLQGTGMTPDSTKVSRPHPPHPQPLAPAVRAVPCVNYCWPMRLGVALGVPCQGFCASAAAGADPRKPEAARAGPMYPCGALWTVKATTIGNKERTRETESMSTMSPL